MREPRAVFAGEERARLAADPQLRRYATLTQDQVAGLLWACGEFLRRWSYMSSAPLPAHQDRPVTDPEVIEAHRALAEAYARCRNPEEGVPPPTDPVFDASEQDELSHFVWVQGAERVGREQIVRLLTALDRYAARATPVPAGAPVGNVSRMMFGHNAVVSFRDRAFTFQEYARRVGEAKARAR